MIFLFYLKKRMLLSISD